MWRTLCPLYLPIHWAPLQLTLRCIVEIKRRSHFQSVKTTNIQSTYWLGENEKLTDFFQNVYKGELLCFKIWNIALQSDEIDMDDACHDGRQKNFVFKQQEDEVK